MPQVRHVMGHLTIEIAAGERKCHRHKTGAHAHVIASGETCSAVDTPVMGKQSYCVPAGRDILAQAKTDLDDLITNL